MLRCFDDSVLYFKVAPKTNSLETRKVRRAPPLADDAGLLTGVFNLNLSPLEMVGCF